MCFIIIVWSVGIFITRQSIITGSLKQGSLFSRPEMNFHRSHLYLTFHSYWTQLWVKISLYFSLFSLFLSFCTSLCLVVDIHCSNSSIPFPYSVVLPSTFWSHSNQYFHHFYKTFTRTSRKKKMYEYRSFLQKTFICFHYKESDIKPFQWSIWIRGLLVLNIWWVTRPLTLCWATVYENCKLNVTISFCFYSNWVTISVL